MENEEYITIVDEDGTEKKYLNLGIFTLPSNDKTYILYTDEETDSDGNYIVLGSEYILDENDNPVFKGIESDEEWNELKAQLQDILKSEGENNG